MADQIGLRAFQCKAPHCMGNDHAMRRAQTVWKVSMGQRRRAVDQHEVVVGNHGLQSGLEALRCGPSETSSISAPDSFQWLAPSTS